MEIRTRIFFFPRKKILSAGLRRKQRSRVVAIRSKLKDRARLSLSGCSYVLLRVYARFCVCRARTPQLGSCVMFRPPTYSLKYIYLARSSPYLSTNTRIRPTQYPYSLERCIPWSHTYRRTQMATYTRTWIRLHLGGTSLESHRPSDIYDPFNVSSRTGSTPFQWQYRYNPHGTVILKCSFEQTNIRSNVTIQQRLCIYNI